MAKRNIQMIPQRGRNVSAPVQHVTLNGTRYTLVFNNKAMRIAEDVYSEQYGKDMGFFDIVTELQHKRYRAIMAIVFSALRAGGLEMSWEDFDKTFTLASLDAVRQAVQAGILAALPTGGEADAQKNEQPH